MRNALDRNIAAAKERIVFVAPSIGAVPDLFRDVVVDASQHRQLVRDVQRMRGGIYLKDGAIQEQQLTPDGLHQTEEDETAWHMLLLDKGRRVSACASYLEHESSVAFNQLRARNTPLAHQPEWRPKLVEAIELDLARARGDGLHYVELGGWAVTQECRGTAAPLALVLAIYGFSRRATGAMGMTTATFRHCSATILKRLGGARFEAGGTTLPPYYDARYRCLMEMIRFDSRRPNPKYVDLIDQARDTLSAITVVTRPAAAAGAFVRPAEAWGFGALAS
jgi:hypothetical protein